MEYSAKVLYPQNMRLIRLIPLWRLASVKTQVRKIPTCISSLDFGMGSVVSKVKVLRIAVRVS